MKQAKRNSSGCVTQRIQPPEFFSDDLPYLDVKVGKDAYLALEHADMLLATAIDGLRACTITAPMDMRDPLQLCVMYTLEAGYAVFASARAGLTPSDKSDSAAQAE